MANKPTYTTVATTAQYSASVLNDNFEKMAVAIEGCLGLGGVTETSNLASGLWDLNNFRIQNVGTPLNDGDAISKSYGDSNYGGAAVTLALNHATDAASSATDAQTAQTGAETAEANASASASAAATSATNAAASETVCSGYSSIGFSTAGSYDFGSITDTVLLFPTDFGLIV